MSDGQVLMLGGGDHWQVACYKICTVKLNRTQQTDDDDDAADTLDSEEAMVRSVMRDGSQDSISQTCARLVRSRNSPTPMTFDPTRTVSAAAYALFSSE